MKLSLKLLLIILISISNLGWIWNTVAKKDREARRLYKEGKIDEALAKWRDAQIDAPDKKELHYNIGNGLYEKNQYEGSFSEYQKSSDSKDAELQAKTYYNMGNTHYRMGKLPEAIEDYERCLEVTPDDEDAKYNIEFIKKKMEELKKQQQAEQDRKEGQRGKQETEKEEEQEKQQIEKGEEQDRASKAKEMSEEDAIRLLDALKDDEKELQKELRMQPIEGRYRIEKDW